MFPVLKVVRNVVIVILIIAAVFVVRVTIDSAAEAVGLSGFSNVLGEIGHAASERAPPFHFQLFDFVLIFPHTVLGGGHASVNVTLSDRVRVYWLLRKLSDSIDSDGSMGTPDMVRVCRSNFYYPLPTLSYERSSKWYSYGR